MVGFLGRLCLRIAGLFLFFLLIFSGAAFAVEPLLLKEDFNGEFIGLHVLHFEDKSRKLTIDDVKSPEYKVKFAPENQTTLNFGFSDSDHWLYFPVKNADSKNVRWLLQLEDPRINLAEAYEETADGGYRAHFSGGQLPVGIRDVKNRKNVFVFDTRPGTSGVFVRVVSPGKTFTNVFMTAWNEKEFTDKNVLESLLLGAFYGSMLGLLLYNFFIFLTVRDASYLWYLLYLASATATYVSSNGLGSLYLWGNSPYMGREASPIFYFFSISFALLFARSFLDTRRHSPRLDQVLFGGTVLTACFWIIAISDASFTFNYAYAYPATFPIPLVMLYAGIMSLRKGVRQARFYVVAWAVFLVCIPFYFLRDLGFLPDSSAITFSVQIGTFVEVILLSLALADRINIMRKEKETAQGEVLIHEQRALMIAEGARDTLEKKVTERTSELSFAKEKAENATKLKDKFVGIVAHDLKSPINAVMTLMQLVVLDGARKPLHQAHKELLEKAVESCRGMMGVIDKLLDINRMQTGQIIISKKLVSCRQLAGEKIGVFKFLAEAKMISLRNDLPPDMTVFADPDLLGECFANLLANAIKFCNKGDEITIFSPEGRPGTVAVRDTGAGISEKIIPDLFSHAVKTFGIGTAGEIGTGLGLPFCRDIMEAHGGTISVESEVGKGSTFFLFFPPV